MDENLQLIPVDNRLAKKKYELIIQDDKIMENIENLINNLCDHTINKQEARLGILRIVVDVILKD